jgi:hypothetical protein
MADATPTGDNPNDNYDPSFDENRDGAHDKAENDARARARDGLNYDQATQGTPQPESTPPAKE